MAITTAMATSFKQELFNCAHCFNAQVTTSGTNTSGQATVTAIASTAGISVGMALTGTNVAASAVVASVDSGTQITMSKNSTGAVSAFTATGDVFKMALIKPGMAGTYGAASTNYTNITGNTDETSGTGYTAAGTALTNSAPTAVGTVGFVSFANPSWTSSTFSTAGCMIYNSSGRFGSTTGRACSVHDFGGNQQVSSGTFTVLMPTFDSNNAILRIS